MNAAVNPRTTTVLAQAIFEKVCCIRNVAPSNAFGSDQNRDALHVAKIEAYIVAQLPIVMVLPAFPAKSANPEKTTGVLPDFGEVLALKRLHALNREIADLYAPGARVVICSDGRVFSDLVGVSDADVTRYGQEIERIIAENHLDTISTYNLEDLFEGMNHDETRKVLTERYAEPIESVRARVLADADAKAMYNGIHRFLFEDMVVVHRELSRNKVRTWSGQLAYSVIQRSNAWSNLVAEQFPQAVRLSIHPQPAHSSKIGIQMVASNNMWRTPWHSSVLFDGQNYTLIRRQDAEAAGAILMHFNGRYPYFMMQATTPKAGETNAVHVEA